MLKHINTCFNTILWLYSHVILSFVYFSKGLSKTEWSAQNGQCIIIICKNTPWNFTLNWNLYILLCINQRIICDFTGWNKRFVCFCTRIESVLEFRNSIRTIFALLCDLLSVLRHRIYGFRQILHHRKTSVNVWT